LLNHVDPLLKLTCQASALIFRALKKIIKKAEENLHFFDILF